MGWSGFAYAATGTSPPVNTPITIPTSNGIACAAGPTYAGSIPAPAAQSGVGFTTCALNADFSNSLYSNTSTWINECGATTPWRFYLGYRYSTGAPCSRADIENDGSVGKNVLHIQFQPGDSSTGNGIFSFTWPGAWLTTTGSPYLPNEMFLQTTFRISSATLTSSWKPPGPFDFWLQSNRAPCTSGTGTCPPSWFENDFMETDNVGQGGVFPWGGGLIDWSNGNAIYGPVVTGTIDPTQYHTLGVLLTSDESSAIAKCVWIDGSPQGCNSMTSSSASAPWNYPQHNNIVDVFLGSGGNTISNNMDIYIQDIRVWECAGYLATTAPAAGCPGTVITTQSSYSPP
jgi:hypothetical protein